MTNSLIQFGMDTINLIFSTSLAQELKNIRAKKIATILILDMAMIIYILKKI